MQKKLPLLFICIFITMAGQAQFTRYIVRFKDKGSNPFSISNPSQYLSQRALDRRARYNISIDSTDLPVTPRYIDSVRLSGNVTILNVSKWLNQVSIQTTDDAALAKINAFPFVLSAEPAASRTAIHPVNKTLDFPLTPIENVAPVQQQNMSDHFDYGKSNGQVKIHQGQFLHNHGFRGEGMQLAVLDAGFFNYNILPTFDSARNNNQILGTWDFVANETSVAEDNSHGMHCLSTIAANMPGIFVGTAPKTSFYLFRTEDVFSEYPVEEHNFASGAEKADSLGVDICSTSLGYYVFDNPIFNYTYSNLDGNTTISAKAAKMAARKGMLMVTAAGNEGNGSWHFIITPADADSSFAIGAVDTIGQVAGFSSYGPSSDGQIKPSVAAVGWNALVANGFSGLPSYSSGTSFACPNMAGISTCLWQAFPEVNNMRIIDVLQQSATKAANPDDRVGYGIPDAKKAFVMLQKSLFTLQSNFTDCRANILFSVKTDPTMKIDIERKLMGETNFTLIDSLTNSSSYARHDFIYTEDLSSLPVGAVQYRLKMNIDADTSFYLDSVTINYLSSCTPPPPTENKIVISPNPVSDFLNISITRVNSAKIDVVIQNAAGQKMYTNSYLQQPGTLIKQLPVKQYSKGIYFVSVFIDNKKEVTKKILRQ